MISIILAASIGLYDVKNYETNTPKSTKCQKVFLWDECSELSHYRGSDYIVFKWWDLATTCNGQVVKPCAYVSQTEQRAYRTGCIVRWCDRKGKGK